jgi:hypothetical protein
MSGPKTSPGRPTTGLIAIFIVLAAARAAIAQDHPPASRATTAAPQPDAQSGDSPPKVLTGKERLGEKWTDEQRVDNCRVPVGKRGAKPRPDVCSSRSE